jgi:hypothetical protein
MNLVHTISLGVGEELKTARRKQNIGAHSPVVPSLLVLHTLVVR